LEKQQKQLKTDYKKQADDSIRLELILNQIISAENISATEEEIDEAIKVSSTDTKIGESLQDPRQREIIRTIIKRTSCD